MTKLKPTPWRVWLAQALAWGVPPQAFWRLSFKEWRALAQPAPAAALDRAGLAALAARFPDIGP